MDVQTLNPTIARRAGMEALAKALGPVGMVRFLQQIEMGSGDYTKEREELLKGMSVKSIVKEIKGRRREK